MGNFSSLAQLSIFVAVGEGVGQVLVIEHRHALSGLAEDGGDLFHQLQARIEDLPLVVARVVAVLGDEQDSLDGQFSAVGQRLGDPACSRRRGIALEARHADAEILGDIARQVVLRRLIDVQRVDVVTGYVQLPPRGVAVEEPAGDVVGVRQRPIYRGEDGEGFASLIGRLARPGARQGQRSLGRFAAGRAAGQSEGGRGSEELATRAALVSIFHGAILRVAQVGKRAASGPFESTAPGTGLPAILSGNRAKSLCYNEGASSTEDTSSCLNQA